MRLPFLLAFAASFVPLAARSQTPTHPNGPVVHSSAAQADQPLEPTPDDRQELVPAGEATSGRSDGLTLTDLEQMALQNNPSLSQAYARVEAARGVWLQVGLYPNPVAGYVAEEMGDEGTAGLQGGFIGQQFVTAGKLRLNRQVACQEVIRLEQELAAQEYRILTDVRTRFYEALVAQRTVETARKIVELAEQGIQAAEALLKAKEASRTDLLQARVEANTTRILSENAENRQQEAWRRLAAVLGIPELTPKPLVGDLDISDAALSWDESLAQLLSHSPELAAVAAEVEAAAWASERARVEWVPDVGVQASVLHNNASGDNVAGLQVSLPLPLFNRNQGNIVAADSRLVAAQRNAERIRLDLQNRLATVYRRYANARQQVEKYRNTILPDAKETLELVTTGYQQGEFSYLNLLTAQRTYFQSNLAYLDSLLKLKSARVQIEGLLLSDSLSVSSDQGSP